MKLRIALFLMIVSSAAIGQVKVGDRSYVGAQTFNGSLDASGATRTALKTGTVGSLPGTCTVGDVYFASDATAGQNFYFCTATNTWTQQLNSGGGGGASFGFAVTNSGGTITVGTGTYRFGGTATTVGSTGSSTAGTGSTTETATFYLTSGALNVVAATNTPGCTAGGFGTCNVLHSAPANAIPIGTCPMVSGAFSGACTSLLAGQSTVALSGGAGVTVNANSSGYQALADTTLLAQKFFGTAAPGSVSGNLPGDLFYDTTAHNAYRCGAVAGTAAPACTSVTTGGWEQFGAGGGGSSAVYLDFPFSGGGAAMATGGTACQLLETAATLGAAVMTACNGYDANNACNTSGSATFDVKTVAKATYASSGPSSASSIHGSGSLLSVSSAYYADGTLTGWSTSVGANTMVCVVLSSPTAYDTSVRLKFQ